MIPKSIRWHLPISYAAIALLTTLSLGLVLLTSLQHYYQQQELDYVSNNARAISARLSPLIEANIPLEGLQSQLNSLAFLSQTQIRLLNPQGEPLADSGPPQSRRDILALSFEVDVEVEVNPGSHAVTQTISLSDRQRNYSSYILINDSGAEESTEIKRSQGFFHSLTANEDTVFLKETVVITNPDNSELDPLIQTEAGLPEYERFASYLPAVGTPYGFEFRTDPTFTGPRSGQRIRQPFRNASDKLLGYIELSNGPAYGQQVLNSVAQGWAIASGVAVLLAAIVGWAISRRISIPLVSLTNVTTRMAAGNLSVRADITRPDELGTLAHSFNDMAQQVEETIITLRRFVADAAHEFHTPLTALRTNLELAVDNDPARDIQTRFIEQAQSQVARLETLTSDLLDLSQLETGAAEGALRPVDLTHLLRQATEPYASQAEQSGLTFLLHLPGEAAIAYGNNGQLRRAISNLLDNAIKFTAAGGTITVSLYHKCRLDWLELSVKDTGIGIPADELPQLFSRFHRGRNATAFPGSGLGLAIVKVIIERHGGQIQAKNTGVGAHFIIWLPAYDQG